ncbi:trypsin-like serine protease [Archangium violaceum]|uniref:trypsin-like serine protease n=1 Tax=Archangium violaceum TaxID=83451 RepID=UPI00193C0211|nr:trypsin-like serine protease [Archangium violaceum]QRK07430.1 trypsin-like serine protease [Archangium violaceum]
MSQRHFVRKFFLLGTASTALLVGCGPEESLAPQQQSLGSQGQEIVGGSDTSISTHPWQISFQLASGFHFCGGSILNESWILTAQHCVDQSGSFSVRSPSSVRIAAGGTQLSTIITEGQVRTVDDVIPFPGYETVSQGKDVALLHLSKPLKLNGSVAPIALATPEDEAAGLTAAGILSTVTGWGDLAANGSPPDTLQAVDVPLVSNEEAGAAYGLTLSEDQLAAGVMGVGGKDSCQGDSGGPLIVSKGSEKILAGVVSWGYGCAEPEFPGMYARVSSFQPWISSFLNKRPTIRLNTTNQSGSAGDWKHYRVSIPSGLKVFNVHISGGTGDADLYIQHGAQPTESSFTCRPYSGGNNETCSIPNPAAGTWFISVQGYSDFSGVRVHATSY